MPPAAMNEDDGPPRREDEIRVARQVAAVEPEAVAEPVCQPPHKQLWRRVFGADGPHRPAADWINQSVFLWSLP